MKKYIKFLTVAIITLIFTGCTESDDEFFATTSVTSSEQIAVSVSGNILNITSDFERLLDINTTNPLDLFLTTKSRKFYFNYSLEKRNDSGQWESFTPDNIEAILGENLFGGYISGIPTLDALDSVYEYDTDITLEPGQYRVSFDPRIVSITANDAVTVIINTTVVGGSGNDLEFTIN